MHGHGNFEVKMAPLEPYNGEADTGLGRMSIDKVFEGDLQAVSKGEMLSAGSPQTGSAGYVAIERVVGTLNRRRGSFSLQHNATMHRGVFTMNIIVAPGSGIDELEGLSGVMNVVITDGKHSYEFEYDMEQAL